MQAVLRAVGPEKWADFAQSAARAVKAASPATRCAAGVLYYERPFFNAFVALKDLDAISLDIYSLGGMWVYDSMIATAQRAGKTVYIEETWRETYTDPCGPGRPYARPGGRLYEDVDSKWLETLCRPSARGLESITACGVTSSSRCSTPGQHAGNLDRSRQPGRRRNKGERTGRASG